MSTDTKSITLAAAKDKIDAPDGKVTAAYKFARDKKPTGRLNLADIRQALKQMQHHAGLRFVQIRDKLSGGKFSERARAAGEAAATATGPKSTPIDQRSAGGAIRRRGGGIAKRGMGIAK